MYNLDGKIGGDAGLSPRGEQYARKLPDLVRQSVGVSFLSSFLYLSFGIINTHASPLFPLSRMTDL